MEPPPKRRRGFPLWLGLTAGAALCLIVGVVVSRSGGPRSPIPIPIPTSAAERQERELRAAVDAAPQDPRPPSTLIQYLLSGGRPLDALDAARAAARRFPDSAVIRALLANALLDAGRSAEAAAAYRPLAAEPEYRLDLVSCLVREGQRGEASRLLKTLPPVSGALALRAGRAHLDLFEAAAAADRFRAAAQDARVRHEAALYYGLTQILLGQYSKALPPLSQVAADETAPPVTYYYLGCALRRGADPARRQSAAAELEMAANAAPDQAMFHYELGLARAQAQNLAGACQAWERAAEAGPDLPEIHRELAAGYSRLGRAVDAAVSRARYLRLVADAPAAVRLLTPLREKDPHNVSLGLALAEAYYEAERYPETLRLLQGLQQQEPHNPRVLWDVVNAETALGHHDRVLAALDALATATPTDAAVPKRHADTLLRLQRFAEAERDLERLAANEPDRAERHYDLGRFQRQWSPRADRATAAEGSLNRALSLQPDHAGARYQLGALLAEAGRPAEAVPHLRRALELNPSLGDAYRLLGRSYAALGEKERAAEMFRLHRQFTEREAREKQLAFSGGAARRKQPAVRIKLADYYLAQGRLPEATRELEAVIHTEPRNREAHQRLAPLYGNQLRFQRLVEEREAP